MGLKHCTYVKEGGFLTEAYMFSNLTFAIPMEYRKWCSRRYWNILECCYLKELFAQRFIEIPFKFQEIYTTDRVRSLIGHEVCRMNSWIRHLKPYVYVTIFEEKWKMFQNYPISLITCKGTYYVTISKKKEYFWKIILHFAYKAKATIFFLQLLDNYPRSKTRQ